MNYKSVREMASKWGLTERRVTALCRERRIPGSYKMENEWLIPEDTDCPKDKRTKKYEAEKSQDDVLKCVAFYILSQEDSGTEGNGIEWKDSEIGNISEEKYKAVRDKLPPAWRTAADKYFSTRKNEVAEAIEIYKKKARGLDEKIKKEIEADAIEKGYEADAVLKALGLK